VIALPNGAKGIREDNRGAVEKIDTGEAAQKRKGSGVSAYEVLNGRSKDSLKTGGGLGSKALVETLGRNRGAKGSSSLSELVEGNARVGEEAEDEGLNEGGTSQLALALNEASGASGIIGDRGQDGV
jgi:hypothetical protein